ncbi:MAG TPA: hypothetical protein PLY87_20215 [Planctomycetaceae bacterium]|mgnify:CR=1 FL=1|nr:hypothetical protein [Planctomycetaceae bacterium]HQZ67430.1 hypothetical protein [Planctomycetaceae bacterium]
MSQSDSHKENFLANVGFGIALAGTAQRGKLYRPESTPDERQRFRLTLRTALENLAQEYRVPITDDRHFVNINDLADRLSQRHRAALNGDRFRIGSAQKALNLYLKMLWCFDRIPTPPHCPFDSIVLSLVPGCKRIKWTQLDSLEDYKHIVHLARVAANGVSLSEWELRVFTETLSPPRAGSLPIGAT